MQGFQQSYSDYFNTQKSKLEKLLNIELKQNVDFVYSNASFASTFKGIFSNENVAKLQKQNIAKLKIKEPNPESFNFAYLLCENIYALDIDIPESVSTKGITHLDVIEVLNNHLKEFAVSEDELIDLSTHYHILSKRGCHIYFSGTNSLLAQKRSVKVQVKGETIVCDWLARRAGQAQADFAFFMPTQEFLGLDGETYKECYYRKPLNDEFQLIKTPSPQFLEALVSFFGVEFSSKVKTFRERNNTFTETPVLTRSQIEQSQILQDLYETFTALDLPSKPVIQLGSIIASNKAIIERLSKRLGGSPSLLDHTEALLQGTRLDGTSNSSMAHYLNAYLADAGAKLDTEADKQTFATFIESLYIILQMSNDNIQHFTKTIDTYHVAEVYNSAANTEKRKALRESKTLPTKSSFSSNNAAYINKDLAVLDMFIEKYKKEKAPIPFYDLMADNYAFYLGYDKGMVYVSPASFKTLFHKIHDQKIGNGEKDFKLKDIPCLKVVFEPSNPELFFVEDSDELDRFGSERLAVACINVYTPSKARQRFFSPDFTRDFSNVKDLDTFVEALEKTAPYTYSLLNNLTGQDKKGIAVICSALARHLENPQMGSHAIVFQDFGGTGKSTLMDAIKQMFASTGVNVTSDSVGSKFLRSSFEGQLFTHCEDLSASSLLSKEFTSFLKTYVGNPTLRLEEKNSRQMFIKNYNLMMITTNYTGAFAVENGTINRRLSIINAATKAKPLFEVDYWNDKTKTIEDIRADFFEEFTTAFVDFLAGNLKFLIKPEFKERYLSPVFEALTEDSKSRISPESVAEMVNDCLFTQSGETIEFEGETKDKLEFSKTKISLAIQALNAQDGLFKADAFESLVDSLRSERVCSIPIGTFKHLFGSLGSQVFLILQNTISGAKVARYTQSLAIDTATNSITRKPAYKVLVLWNAKSKETLPNGNVVSTFEEIKL